MTTAGARGPSTRGASRLVLSALVAVGLAVWAACGRAPSPAPLSHTFDSPDALAREVLRLLKARDRERLAELAVDAREFAEIIWPELPASRPERNLPLEYVWGDLRTKSRGHLARIVEQHGGRRYALVAVSHAGETTTYETFTVKRKTELIVRDDEGRELPLRLFGSLLEHDGRYKIFSFVVD